MKKRVLFSGIQPSGQLLIGHYLGAIKNWVHLQDEFDCLFALVDLHAITVPQDPNILRDRCYELVALYIACGIDPKKNILFVQSQVKAHAELGWILNCFTYMGELQRMTQFKDKSKRHETNINVGLFDYPVLMAADILLYNTNLVPVGDDQKQHLELTRDLAIRFNNRFGDIFTVPEPYIPPVGGRIMSLQDPLKKMSKSDEDPNSYIALLDSPDTIRQKLKRAVTDSGKEIHFDSEQKPGIANLLTIFSILTQQSIPDIEQHFKNKGYGDFKRETAEAIIEFLAPLQKKYHELRQDESTLRAILKQGALEASRRANAMLKKVHDALGFIPQ